MKNESPTIYVSLTEDGHPDDCDCGKHYSAIVMLWGGPCEQYPNGTWHNSGIVIWADTPEKAFNEALDTYKQRSK